MLAHLVRIVGVASLAGVCIVLPFLPGRHDPVAMPLSVLTQFFSKMAWLLVPLGVAWLALDYRPSSRRARQAIRIITLAVSAVMVVVASLLAMLESMTLGLVTLAIGAYAVMKLRRHFIARAETTGHVSVVALCFVIVPPAVALFAFAVAAPLADFSRNRAIRNSAPLIADIERHRVANGRYPSSLVAVWPDYLPAVIGIKEYRYASTDDTYNLSFELPTFQLGTREFVVYNPRDDQTIITHTIDLLQLTSEQLQLERRRGYHAVHAAEHPKWKSFLFD